MTTKTHPTVKRLAFSVNESAEKVGISVATVNVMLKDGTLPSVLLGGRRLVHREALERLIGGPLSDTDDDAESIDCLTYTVKQVTEATPLSEATVNARIADGTIPSLKIAGRRLVRRDVLDRLIRGDLPSGGEAA